MISLKKAVIMVSISAVLWGYGNLCTADEFVLKQSFILINEGKIDKAIVFLNEKLIQNPDSPQVTLSLGLAYLEKKEYKLSEKFLNKTKELEPKSMTAHYVLAMLYEKTGNQKKAIDSWKKVLVLSRNNELKKLAEKHISQLEG